jgi:hypothetical protein
MTENIRITQTYLRIPNEFEFTKPLEEYNVPSPMKIISPTELRVPLGISLIFAQFFVILQL